MKKLIIALVVTLASLGVALGQGLTVWTTFGDQTLEWLQGEADTFAGAFGVPVNVVKLDLGELQQQALLAAPQGEAGDLFVGIPHDQLSGLADGGVLADMSAYATASYLADLGEQARLAYTYAGRLFGLPMFVEGPALVINTDLVPNPPATYEEFIALAQELTTADTFGFMFDAPNFYFAYGWIHTFGGYVFGRDATGSLVADDLGVANEGAVRGAQALKDLRFAYDLIPSGTNYDVANGLFIDGSLAMIYNGPWAISQYRDAGVNVEILPGPAARRRHRVQRLHGRAGRAHEPVQHPEGRRRELRQVDHARRRAESTLARMSGRIPASESALAQVSDDPIIAGFGTALLDSEPMPNIPRMGQVWGPMGSALSIILETADSDVAAALESARSEIAGQ